MGLAGDIPAVVINKTIGVIMTVISSKPGILTLIACTAGACLTGSTQAQVPDLPGWDLVWNDEFDGTSLDTGRWEALNRQDSHNNEKQYYLASQVAVDNGLLTITANDQPIANKQYRSGLVRTWEEHTYGRWEIRANLPTTQGMWPAIWLLPRNEAWPSGGEIDIMENKGSQPYTTSSAFHYGQDWQQHQYIWHDYSATENGQPVNFHESYHNYAVEWDDTYIRFFVDDNMYFSTNSGQVPIPDGPMSLIINLAIGGDFDGDPDGTTVFPQTFDIDYVRYWQKAVALPGDVDGDGYVGITDLNLVLGDWDKSSQTGPGVLLADFNNTGLSGTYEQWSNGTLTQGSEDLRVQANDFGGGWRDFTSPIDATGQTTLEVELDVNAGDVSGQFNIVLIDGDGTERIFNFSSLTVGDDQILSIDLDNYSGDNAIGAVAGLDLANIISYHLQGSFANGNPGQPMDLTFDTMSLGGVVTNVLEGDIDGDGYVGITDLNIILANWDSGTPPINGGTIPEPGTLALIGLGGLAVLKR